MPSPFYIASVVQTCQVTRILRESHSFKGFGIVAKTIHWFLYFGFIYSVSSLIVHLPYSPYSLIVQWPSVTHLYIRIQSADISKGGS